MEASEGELAGKSVGDVYGAEHLCRLLGIDTILLSANKTNALQCLSQN
jgi:hypothetical protein